MKQTSVFFILMIALAFVTGWFVGYNNPAYKVEEKVVTHYDTIVDSIPIADTIILTGEKVRIPFTVHDTIHEGTDSVFILVDREQKFYKDSTYAAWISGIDATLDSIYVFRKNTTKTITKERIIPCVQKERYRLQGYVGGYKSFTTSDIGVNGGVELVTPFRLHMKVGYELNKRVNYPYIGIEYKIH